MLKHVFAITISLWQAEVSSIDGLVNHLACITKLRRPAWINGAFVSKLITWPIAIYTGHGASESYQDLAAKNRAALVRSRMAQPHSINTRSEQTLLIVPPYSLAPRNTSWQAQCHASSGSSADFLCREYFSATLLS